ncbi:MAG: flagellar hook-associated protein FlgL [Hormoscilla sp. GUM202]|nr:flagellar hook-associated protein FlgL [Hormoscilla sp. GUM202]
MVARISTGQYYGQTTDNILRLQSDMAEQNNHISSGERVMTAADDPVASTTIAGMDRELAQLDLYERNMTTAENRNQLMETNLASATDTLTHAKTVMINANNGSLGPDDLKALGIQMQNDYDFLVQVANTKDESGSYVFAGYQVDTAPITRLADGSVIYNGDNGVRELQIGSENYVPANQSGQKVFFDIANTYGDFMPTYSVNNGGLRLESANIVDKGNFDRAGVPEPYDFQFTDTNGDGVAELTVSDGGGGTILGPFNYTPGQTIAFNGLEVSFSGNPVPGDSIQINEQSEVDLFKTMQDAINWIDNAAAGNIDQVEYDRILGQMNSSTNHITSRQAEAGISRGLIRDQTDFNLDYEQTLTQARSNLRDLDYSAAMIEYSQTELSLQATQQAFSLGSKLSLFDFI